MDFGKTIKAGKLLKTHGRQGEIFLSSDFNLNENFIQVESIFISIDGQLVPFFLEAILVKSSKTAAIKLEDIDTVEEANELTGNDWYLTEKKYNELSGEKTPEFSDLIGYTLFDQDENKLGEITNINEIPSNTLLEVQIEDESYDIPFNEETIISIDPEKKAVVNFIPEGLLDL
jgi:16S rRNA processing protein RimM